MSKSVLYAVNTSTQTITSGSVVNFGSLVRRYGCNCNLSGGNVIITGTGYYDIDTNFTFTAGGAGTVVISLYLDGTLIPGATATAIMESGAEIPVSVPAMIRTLCGCEHTLTAVVTGITGTITNASVVVEKV